MPAGPHFATDDHSYPAYDYHNQGSHDQPELNGDQSAASILQSVKEQEAQFEQLTKELEVERQSVATQLEKCKLGSETASMSSISSTDDSFHWRPPPHDARFEEESDADSKMSGSQLVDSCLRVLQERGLMNVKDGQNFDHLPPEDRQYSSHSYSQEGDMYNSINSHHSPGGRYHESLGSQHSPGGQYHESLNSQHSPGGGYQSVTRSTAYNTAANGAVNMYDRDDTGSPGPEAPHGQQQSRTVTTVTKVVTTRQIQQTGGSTSSQSQLVPQDANEPAGYSNYAYSSAHSLHSQPAPPGERPGDVSPRRFNSHPDLNESEMRDHLDSHVVYQSEQQRHYANYDDSFDQQISYRDPSMQEPPGNRYDPRDDPRPHDTSYDYPPPGTRPYMDQPDSMRRSPQPQYGSPAGGSSFQNLPQDTDRGQYSPRGPEPYHDGPDRLSDRGPPSGAPQYSPRGGYPDRLSDRGPPSDIDRYGDNPPHRGPPYDPMGSPPRDQDRGEDPYGSRQEPGYMMEPPRSDRLQGFPPDGRYPPDDSYRGNPDDDPYRGNQGDDPYRGNQGDPYRPEDDRGRYYPPEDNRSQRTVSPAPSSNRGPQPYGSLSQLPPDNEPQVFGEQPPLERDFHDDLQREPVVPLRAPPPGEYELHNAPSIDSLARDMRWRNPDLPEVIEFLRHPSNGIKANAAAYLQHLTYMDDPVKAKTRALGGIPALVELVKNDTPEVHTAACGALRNLSYGKSNDENKKAIKNAEGIPELVRLLRKSPDNDVRELVTGVLWNLSSLAELKKPIIDHGLVVLVNVVVIPHSGWNRDMEPHEVSTLPRDVYWSTVFRNASGVLRNVSSDGAYARKKLRECEGLVDSLMYIVRAAIGKNDIDNKSVENCICVLRNLSYACQEVSDPHYLDKAKKQKEPNSKGDSTGCLGGSSKKKDSKNADSKNRADSLSNTVRQTGAYRGQELLWQPEVVHIYLPLLSDCSNPETLEAAAGAVQNLAACYWQPSALVRATIRKEKGLPIIVELLNLEADRVVCASATALRNLSIDPRNKELIGKYAMKQLVTKLPAENRPHDFPLSDDTICAIESTLYEVIKNNIDFAQSLYKEGGVDRLMYIQGSGRFSAKVVKYASTLLTAMWNFKDLQAEYMRAGYKSQHFLAKPVAAPANTSRSQPASANSTLGRPGMTQSGPTTAGYNENTLPHVNRTQLDSGSSFPNHAYADDYNRAPPYDARDDPYGSKNRLPPESIPMTQMHGSAHNVSNSPVPGYYDTLGSHSAGGPDRPPYPDEYDRRSYNAPPSDQYDPRMQDMPHDDFRPPPGGVPLFPNLPPNHQPHSLDGSRTGSQEPVYAKVNKQNSRRQDMDRVDLDRSGQAPEGAGADSWV